MTEPPRIRIVIDEARIRGMPSRDARRLIDAVERELSRLGPEIARLAGEQSGRRTVERTGAAPFAAPRRIETAGGSIARALLKAIEP